MRIILKRFIVVFLFAIIILSSFSDKLDLSVYAVYTSRYGSNGLLFSMTYEEKLKQAEDTKKELEERKKATQENFNKLKNDVKDLVSYIEDLDRQMLENDLYIEKLNKQIEVKEDELDATVKLLAETKELEKTQYETMGKRIQYMYENGNTGIYEIFLNSASISDLLNQTEYFSKITEYDNNLLNSYIETKRLAAETEAILELDLISLQELNDMAEFNRQSLLTLIEEKNTKILEYTTLMGFQEDLLEEYMEDIVLANRDIDDIKAEEQERIRIEEEKRKREEEALRKREEEERRKREEERLNAASNIPQTDNTLASDMIWPLPGDGRVYSGFGTRVAPTAGASTYHKGVDIGGAYGADIVSVLAGIVETVSYNSTSGNYIIINHGNGLKTAYLHCSKMFVTVGDYVKQGSVIAQVGSTGVSTAPHLHFGVSVNGTYVDPLNYISYN